MTTISKTIEMQATGWQALETAGLSAVSIKKLLTYSVLFAVSVDQPPADGHESVQTWHSGSVDIRDLGTSKVWLKPLQEANRFELLLADSSVVITPAMGAGGNMEAQTAAAGANYAAFANQACKQVTIVNDSGTDVQWQQGGAGVALTVPAGHSFTIFGISNANQIGVRRKDTSNTRVMVGARWEA